MYLVCWNHDCRQTYDAKNFTSEDRDVKCEKCGGTLISPSGKVQLSMNSYVIKTLDPKTIEKHKWYTVDLQGSFYDGMTGRLIEELPKTYLLEFTKDQQVMFYKEQVHFDGEY